MYFIRMCYICVFNKRKFNIPVCLTHAKNIFNMFGPEKLWITYVDIFSLLYTIFPLRFKNHWTETDFVYRICSLFLTILTDSLITDAILWSQCINSCKALLITALYLTVQHSTQNTIVNKKSTAVNLPGILRFWQYLVYAQYCFCPFSTTHEKVSFSYDFFFFNQAVW